MRILLAETKRSVNCTFLATHLSDAGFDYFNHLAPVVGVLEQAHHRGICHKIRNGSFSIGSSRYQGCQCCFQDVAPLLCLYIELTVRQDVRYVTLGWYLCEIISIRVVIGVVFV